MTVPQRPTDALLAEMVTLLDEEIRLMEQRLAQMDATRRAIVRRDDDALDTLLREAEDIQDAQTATDIKLRVVRQTLAEAFGCRMGDMKLSWLLERLSDQQRPQIEYRRQQIILLAEQLRQRHLETALLLSECARINRLVLESLFPETDNVQTYGTRGQTAWQMEAGLVDTEF
ncbi:MAG: flagellar export chaperone FlgN [Planctomycetota bacterium]|jgi:flagellar biosynthesis/type III secretory pathway chaperone